MRHTRILQTWLIVSLIIAGAVVSGFAILSLSPIAQQSSTELVLSNTTSSGSSPASSNIIGCNSASNSCTFPAVSIPGTGESDIFGFLPNFLPDYVKAANELDTVKAFVKRFPQAEVSVGEDQKLCSIGDQCEVFHTVNYSYSLKSETTQIGSFWKLDIMLDANDKVIRAGLVCGHSVGGSAMGEIHPADTVQQVMSECP